MNSLSVILVFRVSSKYDYHSKFRSDITPSSLYTSEFFNPVSLTSLQVRLVVLALKVST